jgi:hypothetical protein
MSLRTARKYRSISRYVFPLAALYVTGCAIGDIIYRSTGHLGFFHGPLGGLRKAAFAVSGHHQRPAPSIWPTVIILAVWLAVLAVELRHQARRGIRGRPLILIIGYCLGAASLAGPLFGIHRGRPPFGAEVLIGVMALSGLIMAVGAWRSWGTLTRVAAPLVCTAGILISLWVFRSEDRRFLGWDSPRTNHHHLA